MPQIDIEASYGDVVDAQEVLLNVFGSALKNIDQIPFDDRTRDNMLKDVGARFETALKQYHQNPAFQSLLRKLFSYYLYEIGDDQ